MSEKTDIFICNQCEKIISKWVGKCSACNMWNSYIPFKDFAKSSKDLDMIKVSELKFETKNRYQTGFNEFDKVLGGGVVNGSLTLLCGSPGVGKSTLLLNIISKMIKDKKVLYISGEESKEQIYERVRRLNLELGELILSNEKNWSQCKEIINKIKPDYIVIDSIQTMRIEDISNASVTQLKEMTGELMDFIKAKNMSCLLIGHITKDGSIAGPRVLEHMVDTVLYLEKGERERIRLLRSIKNRFGSTEEIGVFEMGEKGISTFKENYRTSNKDIYSLARLGKRTSLIKTDVLIVENKSTQIKRVVNGFEAKRFLLLIALITKKLKLNFDYKDLFLKTNSYTQITDSTFDLAFVASIYCAYKDIKSDGVFIGELALNGEVECPQNTEQILKELSHYKIKSVVMNLDSYSNLEDKYKIQVKRIRNIEELPSILEGS